MWLYTLRLELDKIFQLIKSIHGGVKQWSTLLSENAGKIQQHQITFQLLKSGGRMLRETLSHALVE